MPNLLTERASQHLAFYSKSANILLFASSTADVSSVDSRALKKRSQLAVYQQNKCLKICVCPQNFVTLHSKNPANQTCINHHPIAVRHRFSGTWKQCWIPSIHCSGWQTMLPDHSSRSPSHRSSVRTTAALPSQSA